jgi:flagellar biosynthetic protein FliR
MIPAAAIPAAAPPVVTIIGFALVLARCAGAVMLLPGWAETEVPAMIRAAVALALAVLVWPVVAAQMPPLGDDGAMLLVMLARELLAGASLGFLARLVTLALPMAGQMLSVMIGLASVLQTDAAIGAQQTAIARLLGLAAPLLILGGGLHQLPLRALVGSYLLWPAGAMPTGAVTAVIGGIADGFGLALRLAAPFLLASVLLQIALGLLGRLVPQVQVFLVAVPGQVLGGMVLLAALGVTILRAWSDGAASVFAALPGL